MSSPIRDDFIQFVIPIIESARTIVGMADRGSATFVFDWPIERLKAQIDRYDAAWQQHIDDTFLPGTFTLEK